MTTRHTTLITAAFLLSLFFLAGCVTSVDDALPYTRLPEISIASPVQLVASPSHPTSYLSSDSIPAGSKVQVIGADENMAWLLVLHGETLGWMPAFIAGTGIATLTPAIVFEPLDGECTQYLGATFDADEVWTNTSRGDLYVLGSIYRPRTGTRFADASLSIQLSGGGAAVDSDYLHMPLTRSSAVIFFAYSVRDAQRNSRIGFDVSGLGGESVVFQSLFFSNTCVGSVDQLPIGIAKATVQRDSVVVAPQQVMSEQLVATAKPIVRESGPPSSHYFDITLTLCEGDNCDIYLKIDGEEDLLQLTNDPAFDSSPSWSPTGEQFVFESDRSGVNQLYIYEMRRKRVIRQVANSANPKYWPDWSPAGDEIVYQEGTDDKWHLWKVNSVSLERQRLTSTGVNYTPQWSPDGGRIVFSAARSDTNGDGTIDFNDDRHIWVMDSDGTNIRSVTDESQYYDRLPHWMPDGKHIVFRRQARIETGDGYGPGEIYIVNLQTGNTQPLTFTSAFEAVAIPSPDGQQFLVAIDEDGANIVYLANWDGEVLSEFTRIAESRFSIWRPRPTSE